VVCAFVAVLAGCAGRVDCDCDGPPPGEAPKCVDHDNDGYLVGSDGGPCEEVDQRLESSDCDDSNGRIHPHNVEWLGDGEDWDCDGLDEPELCLDNGLEWVGDVPAACDAGNIIIQTRQTCNVCSGTDTFVLVRLTELVRPWFRANVLFVVTDAESVYRVDVSDFDGTSPVLAIPARFSVEAYLLLDGCQDTHGLVSQPTNSSSCTL
jgi:hypothetical protein